MDKINTSRAKEKDEKEDELSFIDTFPSQIGSTSVDNRPIRPRKNYQPQLDVIPEKVKSNNANKMRQKQFLKKKAVYNPKESILKEKQYRKNKAKAENSGRSKVISNAAPSHSSTYKNSKSTVNKQNYMQNSSKQGKNEFNAHRSPQKQGFNKFTEMDSKQKLKKITEILRNNKT